MIDLKLLKLRLNEVAVLSHFPAGHIAYPHKKRDYFIAIFTFFCVAICLISDADASIEKQNALGVSGWVFLIGLLLGENREIRMQVVIAVIFATIGEHFASLFMGGYTYRFGNVPAYVRYGLFNGGCLGTFRLVFKICQRNYGLGNSGLWTLVALGY